MVGLILASLVGVLCVVIGAILMRGNLSMLHSYHRSRVSEQDALPMGRLVGVGMILAGIGIVAQGVLWIVALSTEQPRLLTVGTVALIAGLAVGLGLVIFAIVKYNKGLF
jgi:hypothetical protein